MKRDSYGRYLIPKFDGTFGLAFGNTAYTRATTFAKSISDTFTLSAWSQRMAVKGIALRPDLIALAAATRIDDKKTLDSIVDQAKDAAAVRAKANLGTALHAFTEQVDAGENPEIPDPWRADVRAYVLALQAHGVEVMPEYIEQQVVIPEFGVAGTFDRIVMWNGRPVVADLKTGRDLSYGWNEIAIQLWLYANASAIWDPALGVFAPLPMGIDTETALVFHLPVGAAKCDVYEVDLRDAGGAARLCGGVRAWRKNRKLATLVSVTEAGTFDITVLDRAEANHRRNAPVRGTDLEALSAATKPNTEGDDEMIRTEPDQVADFVATGLAPLAGPGQRGCSVCGRTGHRIGSVKCLGVNDPGRGPLPPVPETAYAADAVTLQDSPSMMNTVAAIENQAATDAVPDHCRCTNRSAGWKAGATPEDPWVCGDCGLVSRAGQIDGSGKPVEVSKTEVARGTRFSQQTSDADEMQHHVQSGLIKPEEMADPFAVVDPEPAPEPVVTRPPTWSERIASATAKTELSAIWKEANAAGEWTDALKAEGLARMAKISEPAG